MTAPTHDEPGGAQTGGSPPGAEHSSTSAATSASEAGGRLERLKVRGFRSLRDVELEALAGA